MGLQFTGAGMATARRRQAGAKEYALLRRPAEGYHRTNSIEGFWRQFKYSIRSTHIHVSGNTWIGT